MIGLGSSYPIFYDILGQLSLDPNFSSSLTTPIYHGSTARGLTLNPYLYPDSLRSPKQNAANLFVKTTITAWNESQDMFREPTGLSQFSPIWDNTLFTPGKSDLRFRLWAQKGLQKISDLYRDNTLMSIEHFKEKFGIPQAHLFKYFLLGVLGVADSNAGQG